MHYVVAAVAGTFVSVVAVAADAAVVAISVCHIFYFMLYSHAASKGFYN